MLSALDIAPRSTGWCAGDGAQLPECGAWAFEALGEDVGELLCRFDDRLSEHIERYRPEALVFEAPILVFGDRRRGNDKLANVQRTLAMTGHVEFVCKRRGIDCSSVDLRAIKKELAGFGGADKEAMVAAAEKIKLGLPAGPKRAREDAADAFGAWLLLLRARRRQLSARFDQALWGARGALL